MTIHQNLFKKLFCLFTFFLFANCTNQNEITLKKDFTQFPNHHGVIVGSIHADPVKISHLLVPDWDFNFDNLRIYIKPINPTQENEEYTIYYKKHDPLFTNLGLLDDEDDFENGRFFALPLPEGEYYIEKLSIFLNQYPRQTYFTHENLNIPFQVTAQSVNYIGQYRTKPIIGENFFGIVDIFSSSISVHDASQIEYIPLKEKYISLPWNTYHNQSDKINTIDLEGAPEN